MLSNSDYTKFSRQDYAATNLKARDDKPLRIKDEERIKKEATHKRILIVL